MNEIWFSVRLTSRITDTLPSQKYRQQSNTHNRRLNSIRLVNAIDLQAYRSSLEQTINSIADKNNYPSDHKPHKSVCLNTAYFQRRFRNRDFFCIVMSFLYCNWLCSLYAGRHTIISIIHLHLPFILSLYVCVRRTHSFHFHWTEIADGCQIDLLIEKPITFIVWICSIQIY